MQVGAPPGRGARRWKEPIGEPISPGEGSVGPTEAPTPRRSSLSPVRISMTGVVWIVVGLIVGASHHFFKVLNTASTVGSAILAVIAWPLVLLHVHIAI